MSAVRQRRFRFLLCQIFLPLAMLNKMIYNIIYNNAFSCRYTGDGHGVICMIVEIKYMKDIENNSIQLFEDRKIRVAWDEQQEELK